MLSQEPEDRMENTIILPEPDRRDAVPATLAARLKRIGRILTVRANQMIVVHGAQDRDTYYIESGKFEVVLMARDGQAVVIRDLGPGQIFGDLAALTGEPRSANVVAVESGRVIAVSESQFLETVAREFDSSFWFMQRLGREVRRLTDKVFELTALSARDRLHCELLRLSVGVPTVDGKAMIEKAPTHETIALRIGSQREVVSREMSKLSTEKIVQKHGRSLLVDLQRLSLQVARELGHPIAA